MGDDLEHDGCDQEGNQTAKTKGDSHFDIVLNPIIGELEENEEQELQSWENSILFQVGELSHDKTKKNQQVFYKSLKFWIILIFCLILISAAGVVVYVYCFRKNTKDH